MNFLDKALRDGYADLVGEGAKQRIVYTPVNHTERFADPEEQVRAEFWAELIYRYDYLPQRIGIEVTVPDRLPSDHADLVVFHDDRQTRPFAVIEAKAPDVTDSEFNQAIEQVCGNGTWAKFRASYVGVVADKTRRFLDFTAHYGVLEREANIIADLPRGYGKPESFKYHKGAPVGFDIEKVDKGTLISTISKCHQTLWGGGRLSPPAAFAELCKILFVKLRDETRPRRKGEPYEFQIKTHESSRRLAERIRALYDEQRALEPEVFSDPIKVDDATLRNVVSHLESVNLSGTDIDIKGVAFERFMDSFFKGDFGQFFTPREIIDFAVDILRPTSTEKVLDPACGSGGFLLHTLDHIRREADEYYEKDTAAHVSHWRDFARAHLFGIEINDEIARVAKMNMIIHGDGHTNVIGADALDSLERIRQVTGNKNFAKDHFDVIFCNPPFGASVLLTERPYLAAYELGSVETPKGKRKPRPSQKSEVLFIERIWQLLTPGEGRAAIILPDGILTNSTMQYVRDFMLDRFQILAVVSLPPGAFSHFGAGVKASVVFVRKRREGERGREREAIFMAAPQKIGFDATGRETENELPAVAKQYREFESKPAPFFV